METTKLSEYQGLISVIVAPNQEAIKKYSQQYEAVLSDREFSSSNPYWQPLLALGYESFSNDSTF